MATRPRILQRQWLRQPQGAALEINKRHWLARHIIFAHDGVTAFVEGEPQEPIQKWQTVPLDGAGPDPLRASIGWAPDGSSYAQYDIGARSYPLTLACWHYGVGGSTLDGLVSCHSSTTSEALYLRRSNLEAIAAVSRNAAGNTGAATATSGYVSGQWRHGIAVFVSDSDRRAYEGGGNKATSTTSRTVSSVDRMLIGGIDPSLPATTVIRGFVAPLVISKALDDAEVARLYQEQRANPWSIFAPRRVFVPVTAAAGGAPTITALSAIGITASSAQPRISYS